MFIFVKMYLKNKDRMPDAAQYNLSTIPYLCVIEFVKQSKDFDR